MASKFEVTKSGAMKAVPAKAVAPAKAVVTAKAVVPAKGAPKTVPADKAQAAPKTSKASPSKGHIVNAETAKVLRDADAGKNLTRYVDEDDMFKKLGIKLGKAKASDSEC
jgi:hypothetical protein